jgi:hypothetical protein
LWEEVVLLLLLLPLLLLLMLLLLMFLLLPMLLLLLVVQTSTYQKHTPPSLPALLPLPLPMASEEEGEKEEPENLDFLWQRHMQNCSSGGGSMSRIWMSAGRALRTLAALAAAS